MNRRNVGILIAGAIIIVILLIGFAVVSVIFNGSTPATPLPEMPTFDFIISTTTPIPTASPIVNTPVPGASTITPGAPIQTLFPLFILNGTPVFPTTAFNNNPPRITTRTPTPISVTVWTYTPSSAPVQTLTPTSIAPQAQTCKNILYPVAAGQQWIYQASALSRTDNLNMSVLSVNNSQGNVRVNNLSTGSTKQITVQCDGDIIRSFPFMSVDALFGNTLNSSLTASYVSGVLAPNEAAFLNNNWALSWSSQYLVSGSTVINRNGTLINVTLNNAPVTLTCQTLAAGDAAFENITVRAGTFRALKVVCTQQGQVTAVVNGITVTGQAEGRSNQWFAPRIGLVKMQVVSAAVRVFDIPFSLLTDNNLELISYVPAP